MKMQKNNSMDKGTFLPGKEIHMDSIKYKKSPPKTNNKNTHTTTKKYQQHQQQLPGGSQCCRTRLPKMLPVKKIKEFVPSTNRYSCRWLRLAEPAAGC